MKSRNLSTRTLKKQSNTSTQSYKFEDEDEPKQWATLKDLCPEDKSKIGKLIQSLASAKEERQNIAKELKEKTKSYKKSVKRITEYSDQVIQDQKSTEIKFKESLHLLQEYQTKFDKLNHESAYKQRATQMSQLSPQHKSGKENQSTNLLKETEQQTDQFTFEDPVRIKQLLALHNYNSSSEKFEFLTKKVGESEQKLKQVKAFEYKKTSEFQPQKQPQSPEQQYAPISEIQKLKLEIEEITNGLKQIQFNQDASFSEQPSPQKFQQQFLNFEAQSRQNDQFEQKLQEKILPKKKEFVSPGQDSSSESDDIELARKLISQKKQKQQSQNKQSKESIASTRPQISQKTNNQTLGTTPSSQTGLVTSDLQRFNKQLDQKLHSMLASSQSYNLSMTQTQQNDYTITPQKSQISQMATPADQLRSASNLKAIKEISVQQSTPKPQQDRPKIYVQHDPATRCLFFQNEKEAKSRISQQNDNLSRASIIQSHVDEQEIDSLIDSLNNKQSRSSFFYNQEESRPRQIRNSAKVNYDQNLYDMINHIESPSVEANNSLAPEQYQKYMDRYQKIVEQYDLQDDTD